MCTTLTPFIYWKLWASIEEQQRAHPKNYQKNPKIYQNLDFDHLKTVYKMLMLGIFPAFYNKFTENILGMWGKLGAPSPVQAGVLLPSELVSQYNCKNLPKTDDNDRTHTNDSNTLSCLIYGQCFFQDKCLIGAIQVTYFGNSKTLH